MEEDTRQQQRREHEQDRWSIVHCTHLQYLHHTGKALLVREKPDVGDRELWVPLSQLRRADPSVGDCDKFDDIELWMPKWLADEKELHYE